MVILYNNWLHGESKISTTLKTQIHTQLSFDLFSLYQVYADALKTEKFRYGSGVTARAKLKTHFEILQFGP